MAQRHGRGWNPVANQIPVWLGVVDMEGKLRLEATGLFRRYLSSLVNQPVTLTLKKQSRIKSRSQLGYLFGCLYPVIADELGYKSYEVEQVHDACMRHLRGLQPEPNPLKLRVSLAAMNHEQVSEYISDLRFWAVTEYGISTPDSDKVEAA